MSGPDDVPGSPEGGAAASEPDATDAGRDWNVVVTVHGEGYTRVRRALKTLGTVATTPYYNVLVMRVDDIARLLEQLDELFEERPPLADDVSRILPLTHTFAFADIADFEAHARGVIEGWVRELAGRSFHVRMHARDWTETTSRREEEHSLHAVVLRALELIGEAGDIAFDDAEVVIDVETIGRRAGMSMWTREQLEQHCYLRVD